MFAVPVRPRKSRSRTPGLAEIGGVAAFPPDAAQGRRKVHDDLACARYAIAALHPVSRICVPDDKLAEITYRSGQWVPDNHAIVTGAEQAAAESPAPCKH